MKSKIDIPRVVCVVLLLVGVACVRSLLSGHLSDEQARQVGWIAMTCFSFATGGKFLNQISDFRGDR